MFFLFVSMPKRLRRAVRLVMSIGYGLTSHTLVPYYSWGGKFEALLATRTHGNSMKFCHGKGEKKKQGNLACIPHVSLPECCFARRSHVRKHVSPSSSLPYDINWFSVVRKRKRKRKSWQGIPRCELDPCQEPPQKTLKIFFFFPRIADDIHPLAQPQPDLIVRRGYIRHHLADSGSFSPCCPGCPAHILLYTSTTTNSEKRRHRGLHT